MESQLAAYKALIAAARANKGSGSSTFNSAIDSFEALFFNHLGGAKPVLPCLRER